LKIPKGQEEQTTQWPKEKGQNDKQRSTKHTHKTRDQVTRTPTKNQGWEVPATLIVVFAMYLAYKERQLIIVFRLVVWVFSHVLSCIYFQV
jgi:hypothetical protein